MPEVTPDAMILNGLFLQNTTGYLCTGQATTCYLSNSILSIYAFRIYIDGASQSLSPPSSRRFAFTLVTYVFQRRRNIFYC